MFLMRASQYARAMGEVLFVGSALELEHLSYANPSKVLNAIEGHRGTVIADDETEDLFHRLPSVSALVFGSNALRSTSLMTELRSDRFQTRLREYLGRGGGLMIMHQLSRSHEDPIALDFLPADLIARAIRRPSAESPGEGALSPVGLEMHESLLLPAGVELESVISSLRTTGANGLYWHWWEPDDSEQWRIVLEDPSKRRGLVLEHLPREVGGRIILCALPLDWIDDQALLANLIHLTAVGNLDVAVLRSHEQSSIELVDIRTELEAEGYATLVYTTMPESLFRLKSSLLEGMHRALLVHDDVIAEHSDLLVEVEARVAAGTLRVLAIPRERHKPLKLWTNETSFSDDWETMQGKFLFDFERGHPDLGVWGSVDGLWATRQTTGHRDRCVDLVRRLSGRVQSGSIDSTVVPTAMYVWLLNEAGRPTEPSLRWLKKALPGQRAGDVLRIGVWLNRAGLLDSETRRACSNKLLSLSGSDSPQDILAGLQYASETADEHGSFLAQLPPVMDESLWNVGSSRVDLLECLLALSKKTEILDQSHLRRVAEVAMVVRTEFNSQSKSGVIPQLKAARVLADYEREHALPTKGAVTAVIGNLRQPGPGRQWAATETANFTRELRSELAVTMAEIARWRRKAELARLRAKLLRPLVAVLVLLLYLAFAVMLGDQLNEQNENPFADAIGNIWLLQDLHVSIFLALTGALFTWVGLSNRERPEPPLEEKP